jgi:hypothetical protein
MKPGMILGVGVKLRDSIGHWAEESLWMRPSANEMGLPLYAHHRRLRNRWSLGSSGIVYKLEKRVVGEARKSSASGTVRPNSS